MNSSPSVLYFSRTSKRTRNSPLDDLEPEVQDEHIALVERRWRRRHLAHLNLLADAAEVQQARRVGLGFHVVEARLAAALHDAVQ